MLEQRENRFFNRDLQGDCQVYIQRVGVVDNERVLFI